MVDGDIAGHERLEFEYHFLVHQMFLQIFVPPLVNRNHSSKPRQRFADLLVGHAFVKPTNLDLLDRKTEPSHSASISGQLTAVRRVLTKFFGGVDSLEDQMVMPERFSHNLLHIANLQQRDEQLVDYGWFRGMLKAEGELATFVD